MKWRDLPRTPAPVTTYPTHPYITIGGWITFDGTATPATLSEAFNVSSLADNGVGDYTVNWAAPFPSADYAIGSCAKGVNTGFATDSGGFTLFSSGANFTAGAIRVAGASEFVNSTPSDVPNASIVAIGPVSPSLIAVDRRGLAMTGGIAGYWLNASVSGGTPAIDGHWNVSSITDNAAGDFTINFIVSLPTAEYIVANIAQQVGTGSVFQHCFVHNTSGASTSAVRIAITDYFDGAADSPTWTSMGIITQ